MSRCLRCGKDSILISSPLEVCADCISSHFAEIKDHLEQLHAATRDKFGLPTRVPDTENGLQCGVCVNRCRVPEGERGYCGVRINREGRLLGVTPNSGLLDSYYDSLPANCIASWACPAGSSCGYPVFSYAEGPEYGYKNLAVFFNACSFNCLGCQNWHFRDKSEAVVGDVSARALADRVDGRTSCICFFGGDPTPQIPYAVEVSRLSLTKLAENKRALRICWETNGSMNEGLLKQMLVLSLGSGGCVKFDLKAWDEGLHITLTGITNRRTLKNFETASLYCAKRKTPPLLYASTLLVPGYVDEKEVSSIARFIRSLDPHIPYSLLAFAPNFYLHDLPYTSKSDAEACLDAAKTAGLTNVRLGNTSILQ